MVRDDFILLVVYGIVGAHILLECALAFALKYEKVDGVSITLCGDGAMNQGQLYEALNMATLWNLPIVLVCENNHYSMGTTEWREAKCSAYYKRGHYVPGLKILEMDTYRYHGHLMSEYGVEKALVNCKQMYAGVGSIETFRLMQLENLMPESSLVVRGIWEALKFQQNAISRLKDQPSHAMVQVAGELASPDEVAVQWRTGGSPEGGEVADR
ncbi:pyruvate dehydrogenase E1 component subunit alpha-2, mitochondrial-like [Cryptomeria japonica]|uniref:pyruvate dehydrogenase E1 component subunit alpha-2, mitochondrial-like n=1 Tax=Cryptomeria japonica TaxID=3369 RepID=UPI0027DA294D|nr:pyruvate dehydrogenase E1 component subunit alpha-2, mitochondrial-like [Cryptomeria japonica]